MTRAALHRDTAYLELVRDLGAATMNLVQGAGATICAVVRVAPDRLWIGLTPHNQLAWRYALQLPIFDQAGRPLGYHDVVWTLRRSESIRRHDRARFESLNSVGDLHGVPVLDTSDFLDDPALATPSDALRATLLAAAGEPAPLPPESKTRLAGFSWSEQSEPAWARFYFTIPVATDVIGVDIDIPTDSAELTTLMNKIESGIPTSWASRIRQPAEAFCDHLLDLRS
ncbi:hypothetical protein [Saccharopolyspora phatthalungensis]|uniref:Uncharacterized protein n=1 Tax=Saccharopolyspora phatthalungensis TaxID=664693 RepID=A0A840PWF0_9PSEU|nr:hypothetical protein [Saccharopolyspora phatthalungensis]MBB5152646.1 hypothetical protein [Saccharopolyspora phatthalungensis]